jgi:hypothetical protein
MRLLALRRVRLYAADGTNRGASSREAERASSFPICSPRVSPPPSPIAHMHLCYRFVGESINIARPLHPLLHKAGCCEVRVGASGDSMYAECNDLRAAVSFPDLMGFGCFGSIGSWRFACVGRTCPPYGMRFFCRLISRLMASRLVRGQN